MTYSMYYGLQLADLVEIRRRPVLKKPALESVLFYHEMRPFLDVDKSILRNRVDDEVYHANNRGARQILTDDKTSLMETFAKHLC